MQKMNDLVSREAVLKLIIDAQYKLNCDLSVLFLDVAEMPTFSGWISVKDRLPECSKRVIVLWHGDSCGYTIVPAIYISNTNGWYFYSTFNELCATANGDIAEIERIDRDILAWQPLPKPPGKGDNDD